jgi:hypothetical protein
MKRTYHVIGACSCWGAQLRACEGGPEDLADGRVFERLKKSGALLESLELLYPAKQAKEEEIPMEDSLPLIKEFNLQLTQAVKKQSKKGCFLW